MKHIFCVILGSVALSGTWAFANSDPAAAKPAVAKAKAPSPAPVKAGVANPVAPTVATVKPVKKEASEAPRKGSLEEQLRALDAGNAAPAGANREKLYAVQERYLPLRFKNEFSFGGASNLTGDSFLRTQQLEVGYHFHFGDRWSLGLAYAWVENKLKSDADGLKNSNGALPDIPFAKTRADLTVEYNVFYGKFRWSADTVSYFDQYIALGPASIEQNTGTTTGIVGDIGFAFWLGKFASTRLGLKDYYYKEQYRSGALMTNNIHAHLDLGVLF